MKIATYNIRNLYDAGTFIDERAENAVKEDHFNKRVEHFSETLKNKDLDIICLQEIGGDEGIKKIAENIGYNYFSAKPNKRGIRVAALFKKELGNVAAASLSLGDLHIPSILTAGDTSTIPPISQRRDVLTLDVDNYEGKALRVVSFHLKSLIPTYLEGQDEADMNAHTDAKFRSIFYKMMELRALRGLATKSIEEGKEIIFLGDFNENNNSSGIDILKSSMEDKYRLYDVMVGYEGNKTTHIHRGNPLTFDTILVTEWIKNKIQMVEVDNQNLKDYSTLPPGDIEHVIEADHAMVWVDLKP